MSLLSRAASAVEEKAGTSPIESHFGARLIYFFLLLVRMQIAASYRSELFPTPSFCPRSSGTVPSGFVRSHHDGTQALPASLSLALSLSLSLSLSLLLSRISIPLICLALIVREA